MKLGFRGQKGDSYRFLHGREDAAPGETTCVVRICQAAPKHKNTLREIHNLTTPNGSRGLGQASKMLENVCKEADIKVFSLILIVNEDEKSRLCSFYDKFGFIITQDDAKACVMIRLPSVANEI
jgi:5-deoxy-D-glucuronate isomerase